MLALRKVSDNIKASVFADLKQAILEMGLEHSFKITESPMEMTYLPHNTKIIFKGMNTGRDSDNLGGQRLGSFSYFHKTDFFLC